MVLTATLKHPLIRCQGVVDVEAEDDCALPVDCAFFSAMKEEIIDNDYDRAILGPSTRKRPSSAETEESILVAKRIKQELGMDDDEPQEIIVRRLVREPPPPIVFDHFICMRIGLNSENNVQKLMAILSAHNFVDLTVIPGPSILPSVIATAPPPPLIQFAEPSSSRPVTREIEELPARPKKYAPRRQPGDNLPGIPTLLKCTKCHEVMGTGATCNSILAHVQKFHLKMAAFQCRICKHYRTTQERIQSHVTTVHKARSTSFDDTLAGPISEQDMVQMEKMINACFPEITVKLEITDRLSVKSFLIKKNSSKR